MLANLLLVSLASGWDVVAAVVAAGAVVAFGRWRRLSWNAMGLGPGTWAGGLRWGVGAVLAVAVFYAVTVALPVTREATDDLAAPAGDSLWVTALLLVPLRTVLVEELTFRGVLWGLLERRAGTRWALVGTAVAFGFWHVAPALSLADRTESPAVIGVLGVVVFTTGAGLVLGELRRRSRSVIAPAAFHWATNGLGLLAAYLA
jgi:membrane protease YdiL (CAAX protease family)